MMSSLKAFPSFIILTETLNRPEYVQLCNLGGYVDNHTMRSTSRGGGVSVFATVDCSVMRVETLSPCNEHIEVFTISASVSNLKIAVVGIYRPPSGQISDFLNYLEIFFRKKNI